MMFIGSIFTVFGEVDYEIRTGYRTDLECFRATDGKSKGYVLELRTYHAAPGKLDALLARFRDHTCQLFVKHEMCNIGYWVPAENPDNLLIYLMAYRGMEARDASWKAFLADPDWKKAQAASEVDGKLVEKVDQIFMTPTDFSEGFAKIAPDRPKGIPDPLKYVPAPAGNEHLFEMRTYIATPDHLPNLHDRFRDHTIDLFEKHGITNLAYFQLTPDQKGADNTLIYFVAHKDRDAAKESWSAFSADPDWIAAKKASEEKAEGSLTEKGGVSSVFLVPTDFSPVK